jgi:hypothetical protein
MAKHGGRRRIGWKVRILSLHKIPANRHVFPRGHISDTCEHGPRAGAGRDATDAHRRARMSSVGAGSPSQSSRRSSSRSGRCDRARTRAPGFFTHMRKPTPWTRFWKAIRSGDLPETADVFAESQNGTSTLGNEPLIARPGTIRIVSSTRSPASRLRRRPRVARRRTRAAPLRACGFASRPPPGSGGTPRSRGLPARSWCSPVVPTAWPTLADSAWARLSATSDSNRPVRETPLSGPPRSRLSSASFPVVSIAGSRNS